MDFIEDTLVTDGTGIILDPIITGVSSSISWFPSTSLTCDDCLNPSAFPTESGWYYITVIDANGCTSLDSIYILVDFDFTILAPNAFSPNGDGINDEFNVLDLPNVTLFIYEFITDGEHLFLSRLISI